MAGWATPPTFTAGDNSTVPANLNILRDDLNAINGYVLKTADESVTSSTTLQNDDELAYTIGYAGTYVFDLYVNAVSAANAAGDIAIGFSFPTGTLHFGGLALDNTLASASTGTVLARARLSATSGTTNNPYGASTLENFIWIHGVLIATATGTLQMMWAQDSSNANATTVKAGSHLLVRQVA